MLKIVAKISMGLFLFAVPFLFYGFGGELIGSFAGFSAKQARWISFFAGFAVFFPFVFVARRLAPSVWSYLEVLEHEMTHLIVGLFFLKVPVSIRVSAHQGGEVKQVGFGSTGQTWVALAPYFFPTVSLLVLLVAVFVELSPTSFLALLGWTTAFHLVTNWAETSFRQTDLKKAGIVKTILILPVMNLLSYGSILAFVSGGRGGFLAFWIDGFRNSLAFGAKILSWIFCDCHRQGISPSKNITARNSLNPFARGFSPSRAVKRLAATITAGNCKRSHQLP